MPVTNESLDSARQALRETINLLRSLRLMENDQKVDFDVLPILSGIEAMMSEAPARFSTAAYVIACPHCGKEYLTVAEAIAEPQRRLLARANHAHTVLNNLSFYLSRLPSSCDREEALFFLRMAQETLRGEREWAIEDSLKAHS